MMFDINCVGYDARALCNAASKMQFCSGKTEVYMDTKSRTILQAQKDQYSYFRKSKFIFIINKFVLSKLFSKVQNDVAHFSNGFQLSCAKCESASGNLS